MQCNEQFPQWITANAIIRGQILPLFGVHVGFEDTQAKITFLPEDAVTWVPPEDVEKFVEIYNAFAAWVFDALSLGPVLESFLYSACNDQTATTISEAITERIEAYESAGNVPLRTKFLEMMGVQVPISHFDRSDS